MFDILENEVVNVLLILGGAVFVFGAVKLGMAIYKAEKKIKEIGEKEENQDDN
ncbi:MAG: hypothetical protein IJT79_06675 [Ruminococcus sp.]|nr:hypothetical protein [Ruminococcus sp.]